MDKFTIKGTKKLFGLTRTKIRLAEEAGTQYTNPMPLPLVKLFSGREVETVERAGQYLDELKLNINYGDPKNTAKTILELMDIIEGVKYKFEPGEFMSNIDEIKLREIEETAKETRSQVNVLLMTENAPENPCILNLFVGYAAPENTTFLSRVPTTLAYFLNFAFNSGYFSGGLKLKNINIILGHRTLILNAVSFALSEFGANLINETGK